MTEASEACPVKFNGKVMLEAEALLRISPFPATAIRFGGIYGPGRTRLINRVLKGEGCPAEPANIQQQDSQRRTAQVLLLTLFAETWITCQLITYTLGVDSNPATTHDVLQWLGKQLGVSLDNANYPSPPRGNKRCSNQRIVETGYKFYFPDFKTGYSSILNDRQ